MLTSREGYAFPEETETQGEKNHGVHSGEGWGGQRCCLYISESLSGAKAFDLFLWLLDGHMGEVTERQTCLDRSVWSWSRLTRETGTSWSWGVCKQVLGIKQEIRLPCNLSCPWRSVILGLSWDWGDVTDKKML